MPPAAGLLLTTLAGLYALAAARAGARDAEGKAWARGVADALPGARLPGEGEEGARLRVEGEELRVALVSGLASVGAADTLVELRVRAPLPPGLDLRPGRPLFADATPEVRVGLPEVDEHYVVRAVDPLWAGLALGGPAVGAALLPLRQLGGSVALVGGVLRVVMGRVLAPDALLRVARGIVGLARAIARGSVQAWRDAATDHGLSLRISGALAMRLESEAAGVSLRFATARPQAPGTQVLRVRVPGMPEDLRVLRRLPEHAPGRPLGDLILDRGLRAAGGPPDLGARLGRGAVRGPLLEFLHGPDRPGVRRGGLELAGAGGRVPHLLARLAELRALAGLLEAAWR